MDIEVFKGICVEIERSDFQVAACDGLWLLIPLSEDQDAPFGNNDDLWFAFTKQVFRLSFWYGFVVLLRGRGALEHQQLGLQEIRGTMSSYCNCCQFLRVLYALYAWLFDQFESQICPCAVANAPLQSKTPPCLILRCNSSKKTCFFWC